MYNIDPIIDHFFVEQDGTLFPFFNGRTSGPASGAFVQAVKAEDAKSPDGTGNIDWLELQNVSGDLAKVVYRIHTVAGQPPTSVSSSRLVPVPFNQRNFSLQCTPGSSDISIKYTAQYGTCT